MNCFTSKRIDIIWVYSMTVSILLAFTGCNTNSTLPDKPSRQDIDLSMTLIDLVTKSHERLKDIDVITKDIREIILSSEYNNYSHNNIDKAIAAFNLPGITSAPGCITIESDYIFKPGTNTVLPNMSNIIEKIAKVVSEHSNEHRCYIAIISNVDQDSCTDPTDTSSRQSVIIAKELASAGVLKCKIHVVGMGCSNPIKDEVDEINKRINRRIYIMFTKTPAIYPYPRYNK
jgi:hypothetical protein